MGYHGYFDFQPRNEADDQEVKNIVNELLKTRSLATLAAAECPLSNVGVITQYSADFNLNFWGLI
jgi:hypothetical protein